MNSLCRLKSGYERTSACQQISYPESQHKASLTELTRKGLEAHGVKPAL